MKRFAMLMVVLTLALALTACGGKDKQEQKDDAQNQETTQNNDQETAVFTGVLEEKKDFMLIVKSEDDVSYIFNLDDGVTCEAEVGDKITLTYTGDITKFDPSGAGDEHLIATKVEKAA